MKFDHARGTVILRKGSRPSAGVKSYDCLIKNTSAGVVISGTYRGKFTVWSVSWPNMPEDDKTALESFFIHTRGISDLFVWTWPDGTVKTVRFNNSSLQFHEKTPGVYELDLELME